MSIFRQNILGKCNLRFISSSYPTIQKFPETGNMFWCHTLICWQWLTYSIVYNLFRHYVRPLLKKKKHWLISRPRKRNNIFSTLISQVRILITRVELRRLDNFFSMYHTFLSWWWVWVVAIMYDQSETGNAHRNIVMCKCNFRQLSFFKSKILSNCLTMSLYCFSTLLLRFRFYDFTERVKAGWWLRNNKIQRKHFMADFLLWFESYLRMFSRVLSLSLCRSLFLSRACVCVHVAIC